MLDVTQIKFFVDEEGESIGLEIARGVHLWFDSVAHLREFAEHISGRIIPEINENYPAVAE